jgi:hypothetical protein
VRSDSTGVVRGCGASPLDDSQATNDVRGQPELRTRRDHTPVSKLMVYPHILEPSANAISV